MSTTTYEGTLDVSQTPGVPLSRLVRVELRKMYDTKAGAWLLGVIGIVTTLAIVLFGLLAKDGDKTFSNFAGFAATPQGFLLPVMAILLITQEWGQRTAMVT
ncbi:MAG: ABC transporter permease, partial [Microbacterium sp.]